MTKKTHLENAQRLRRETDEALRAPLPSMTKIKLLVSDLVTQVEALAAAVDGHERIFDALSVKVDVDA